MFEQLQMAPADPILGLTATDPAERLGAAEAMQREFDILMSLHHENIVQALTSCYHGDSFWLFMELLELTPLLPTQALLLPPLNVGAHAAALRSQRHGLVE